jgi:predicted nucleic acid-binding protein
MHEQMRFGFDTGYFVKYVTGELDQKHRRALQAVALQAVAEGGSTGLSSAIVIYELKKLGLRGVLSKEDADWLARTVGDACEVDRHLPDDVLDEAARLSHGNGLSMADSMVLMTALRHDAGRIYTSDSDLMAYDGPIEILGI